MSSFNLKIELGNDAMRSGAHVATALQEVASKLKPNLKYQPFQSILDINGNIVGSWYIDVNG